MTALGFSENGVSGVAGEVCVTNKGEVPTQGLTLLALVEHKIKHDGFQPLPGASLAILPDLPLDPGETLCYPYRVEFTPAEDAKYRLVARVTIANHSGYLPGGPHCPGPDVCPFGPDPKADFSVQCAHPNLPKVDPPSLLIETPISTPVVDQTPTPVPPGDPAPGTPTAEPDPALEPSPTSDETAPVEPSPIPEETLPVEPSPLPTQVTESPVPTEPTLEVTPAATEPPVTVTQPPDPVSTTPPSPEETTEPPSSSETPTLSP